MPSKPKLLPDAMRPWAYVAGNLYSDSGFNWAVISEHPPGFPEEAEVLAVCDDEDLARAIVALGKVKPNPPIASKPRPRRER